jgi:hypothetical protein
VVSDITGKTGMRIIRSIIDGVRDPGVLAQHRDGRCHASEASLIVPLRPSNLNDAEQTTLPAATLTEAAQ